MESERLPGKPMLEMAGEPMIHWVLTHAANSPSVGFIYALVPGSIPDLPLIDYLCTHPVRPLVVVSPYRAKGNPTAELRHLLSCYSQVSHSLVRLTADNPLVGPDVIEEAIGLFVNTSVDIVATRHDFLCPRVCYPPGFDVEVIDANFAKRTLGSSPPSTWTEDKRKFTTLFAYNQGTVRWVFPALPPPAGLNVTVDTEADFKRVGAMMAILGPDPSYEEVVSWYQKSGFGAAA